MPLSSSPPEEPVVPEPAQESRVRRDVPPPAAARRMPLVFVKLAAQDWLLLAYLTVLLVQVLTGSGPRKQTAIHCVLMDFAVWAGVLAATRTRLLADRPRVASVLYRAGIGFPVLASFLQLQYILPTAGRHPLDAQLYAFDLRVFGVEPAQAWDRFVTPGTTEWFAFFYYGYFFLIAVHVLPMLGGAKSGPFLAKFSFGFIWLYCVGHALYTFVPAYGPYSFLAHDLHHPLEGSFWWPLVRRAVDSVDGGARTDVFPSLHTAMPTYLSIFSFLERKRMPFKLTWLPLALFTTQIIGATMFLRWHYLVDICAGLTLAASAILMSRVALRWDAERERQGGSPAWPPAVASPEAASSEAHG
jgi:PAP2 superfamily protein